MAKKKSSKKDTRPAPVVAQPGPDRLERDIEKDAAAAAKKRQDDKAAADKAAADKAAADKAAADKAAADKAAADKAAAAEQQIKDLAYTAAGYSGDTATANLIRSIEANSGDGAGTPEDRIKALQALIAQGKEENLALRGGEEVYANISDPVNVTGSAVDAGAWASQIEALAYEAAGLSGDPATAAYIRLLVANSGSGAGTVEERISNLKKLIAKGEAQLAAGKGDSSTTGTVVSPGEKTSGDVFIQLKAMLSDLGLSGLDAEIKDLIARNITKSDDIIYYLRDTAQYQTRFRANAARAKKGLSQLLPAAYTGLEQQYRQTLIANGFDPTLYDEYSDFEKLIAGDVSNAELQNRINEGYRQVAEADPEVVRQMQELYKVGPAQLAQYFLDPEKTLSKLKQQATAANIAARGKQQGKIQMDAITAEELVSRGYTEAQAQTAFTALSEQEGLYKEMMGETALTQSQKIGAAFGYDVSSEQEIARRKEKRRAPFLGGGSYASTTGATSSTRETGLGVAE